MKMKKFNTYSTILTKFQLIILDLKLKEINSFLKIIKLLYNINQNKCINIDIIYILFLLKMIIQLKNLSMQDKIK